jgi:hypothetical protein
MSRTGVALVLEAELDEGVSSLGCVLTWALIAPLLRSGPSPRGSRLSALG